MTSLSSRHFLGAVLAGFLVLLFFIPNLVRGKVPIPADALLGLYHPWRDNAIDGYNPGKFPTKNPLITDPILQTYPWRNLIVENFKRFDFPLWNPYSFSGQPLLGNVQSAPFQILNIFFFILPFKIAWSLQIITPPVLTSIFMYLMLKNLRLSTVVSVFGAFVLPISGFFLAWLEWGTVITTAMWLPLIILSSNKLFEKTSAFWFIALVLALSQTLLSGHWQTAFYVFIAFFLYAIYFFYHSRSLKNLSIIIFGFILALLISSVQTLPALEFIKLSARDIDQGYFPGREDWFLPIKHLIQLIAPDFFGNPATYNYWGIWNYAEFVSFIGIVPLSLAFFSISKRQKKSIFFLGLVIISLVLATQNPISKVPYLFNLLFISSTQPSRIIFLLIFSTCTLAAFGLDQFLKEKSPSKIFFISLLIPLVLVGLGLYTLIFSQSIPDWPNLAPARIALRNLIFPTLISLFFVIIALFKLLKMPLSLLIFAIFSISLFELFRFGYKFTPFSKMSWIFPDTKTTDYLQNQKRPFRIISLDRRIFNGNTPSVYRLEAVSGYDPLFLKDYAQLATAWESGKVEKAGSFNRIITPTNYDSVLTDLLNVRYIVAFDEISKPNFEKVLEEGETKVYENKRALPRAFFVNEIIKEENQQKSLSKIINGEIDIRKTAISQDVEFAKIDANTRVEFTTYGDQSFKLKTYTDVEVPLVIANVFYPGWRAYIDGQESPIYKVNYILQMVKVSPGGHSIEFKFKPQSFYNGLYLTAFGLVATAVFSIYLWRKKYL